MELLTFRTPMREDRMNATRIEARVEVYTPRDENEVVVIAFRAAAREFSFELRAPYTAVANYVVSTPAGDRTAGAIRSCRHNGRTLTFEFTKAAATALGLPQSLELDVDGTEEEVASAGTWIDEMLSDYAHSDNRMRA